ncbi:MAG: hypothetical protein LBE76_02800 [Nitrososphaerota archaeon]|jgi:hypothetical protein|nr:hypothetical protein [Nitrososphaerota archaeon]
MSTLFNVILRGSDGIYTYLLELPLIAEPPSGGTIGQQLGVPMSYVFGIMRNISLGSICSSTNDCGYLLWTREF